MLGGLLEDFNHPHVSTPVYFCLRYLSITPLPAVFSFFILTWGGGYGYACGGQGTTYRGQFYSSTWVLEVRLRSQDLAASSLTCGSLLLASPRKDIFNCTSLLFFYLPTCVAVSAVTLPSAEPTSPWVLCFLTCP